MIRKTLILSALLLCLAASAWPQSYITSDQAVESLRQFWNDSNLPIKKIEFMDGKYDSQFGEFGHFGPCYGIHLPDDHPLDAWYFVRASDGVVVSFGLYSSKLGGPDAVPAVKEQEAIALAEKFVRQHTNLLNSGKWSLKVNRLEDQYGVTWTPILNSQYGTLAPYGLFVNVDGQTGRANEYEIPPNRAIAGPTVPRVSLAQARRTAASGAYFDPRLVPFQAVLRLREDALGVGYLQWELTQTDPDNPRHWDTIHVNAMTGEASYGDSRIRRQLGGIEAPKNRYANPHRKPLTAPKPIITLRLKNGSNVVSAVPPRREKKTLWVRAEMLRGLGVRVTAAPKTLRVHLGAKDLPNAVLGAKWQDGGWWISLQAFAAKAGWQMQWDEAKQQAVFETADASAVPVKQK